MNFNFDNRADNELKPNSHTEILPTITVITPIYNRAFTFERTLDSVLNEMHSRIEYLVVSDGSEDISQLRQIFKEISHSDRIKLIEVEQNSGTCAAINHGARHAISNWIMFLGSDDQLVTGGIEKLMEIISGLESETDFIYYSMIYDDGIARPRTEPPTYLNLEKYLKHINVNLGTDQELGVLIKREQLLKFPLPENHAYEDFFHLQINKYLTGIFVPVVVKKINTDLKDRASKPIMQITSKKVASKFMGQKDGFETVLLAYHKELIRFAPQYFFSITKKYFKRNAMLMKRQPMKSFFPQNVNQIKLIVFVIYGTIKITWKNFAISIGAILFR